MLIVLFWVNDPNPSVNNKELLLFQCEQAKASVTRRFPKLSCISQIPEEALSYAGTWISNTEDDLRFTGSLILRLYVA